MSQELADRFAALRPYLTRHAYSQLGSLAEAEDVVQEAWLGLERVDADAIEDLRAWLTTVTGRLALDALGSARVRREAYVGEWLPDPLLTGPAPDADPADRVTTSWGAWWRTRGSRARRARGRSRSGRPRQAVAADQDRERMVRPCRGS